MKKILIMAIVAFLFSFSVNAQLKIGVTAGGDQHKQYVNATEGSLFSNDHFRSYHAGLIGELPLAKNFYLQPELLYSRKGATLQSSMNAADTKVRIDYVEVPIYLVYKLPLGFGNAFAGAGAAFGYAIGGKLKQGAETERMFRDNGKDWRREDLSLNFKAGLELNNGLFASINSQKGLKDIYQPGGTSIKNRSLSFSVGYMVDIAKLTGR